MSDSILVQADINQASAFKGYLNHVKETKLKIIPLIFTTEGIYVNVLINEPNNKDRYLMCSDFGKTQNMRYRYSMDQEEYVCPVEVQALTRIFNTSLKNDGFKIFIVKEYIDRIYIEFTNNKVSSPQTNLHFITICNSENPRYATPTYTPNSRVVLGQMTTFENITRSLKKVENGISIKLVNGSAIIERNSSGANTACSVYSFGEDVKELSDDNEVITYKLGQTTVSVIQKINALCNKTDNISIIGEEGNPLLVSCNVGNFGNHLLYIYTEDFK
jgi:hypothetical protein